MTQNGDSSRFVWYDLVKGRELQQGDILRNCPLISPPSLQVLTKGGAGESKVEMQDAIVLSQSCDLAEREDGECKAEQVILCPIYSRSSLSSDPNFSKAQTWEDARRGKHANQTVLNKCEIPGYEFDYHLVSLDKVFSLQLDLVRELAVEAGERVRLNPPYREHLSQAFARCFMRVGLPVDIPSFRGK